MSEEWRLLVHYALHGALSLGGQQNYGLNRGESPEVGDVAQAIVKKIIKSFAIVEFKHYGKLYLGSIHISEFTKLGYGYISNLKSIVQVGDEYRVALKKYDENRESWEVEIVENDV